MDKKEVKNILISQPAPANLEKSQYKGLAERDGINLTFEKFFSVVGIPNKEFRTKRISLLDYTAVILSSKLAIDNYFRMAKELRIKIPETMKYFCVTEAVANYLQNYIQYRKRKIFFGKVTFKDLMEVICRHKEENYIFPCAEDATADNFLALEKAKIHFKKAIMYRSEPKDLKEIDISKFDLVAVFTPIGAKSFIKSFPAVKEQDIIFAAFGEKTQQTLKNARIKVLIPAPSSKHLSLVMAIENYLDLKPEDYPKYLEELEAEEIAKILKKREEAARVAAKIKREAAKVKSAEQNKTSKAKDAKKNG
ncbi:MAG: uroporphyrinogen-III synthase [Bacteroidales bacterium]|jgi:uroporphyrinogen-III synthase|nr:uroporphyrinogen-III synthase [Bacteroidales bacterium]